GRPRGAEADLRADPIAGVPEHPVHADWTVVLSVGNPEGSDRLREVCAGVVLGCTQSMRDTTAARMRRRARGWTGQPHYGASAGAIRCDPTGLLRRYRLAPDVFAPAAVVLSLPEMAKSLRNP